MQLIFSFISGSYWSSFPNFAVTASISVYFKQLELTIASVANSYSFSFPQLQAVRTYASVYYILFGVLCPCIAGSYSFSFPLLQAVAHIESSTGVPVEKVNMRKLKHSFHIWSTMMSTSGDKSFCHLMGNCVNEVNPFTELLLWCMGCRRHTIAAIGLGIAEKLQLPPTVQQKLKGMCQALKQEFQQLLGSDGIFLYPPHPRPAPYHNQPLVLIPNFAYTGIFNVMGMPVTSVPMGLSKEGVPIGLQVAGAQMSDRLTIAVAEELESVFGGWVPPFQS